MTVFLCALARLTIKMGELRVDIELLVREMRSPSVEHAPNGPSTNSGPSWRGSVSTREWRIRSGTLCSGC